MEPVSNIVIPRFDLERAISLLQRGRRPSEVIAAAERLGATQLKREIEQYIESHKIELYIGSESECLKYLQLRELGVAGRRAAP